jgi:hypothetical protein
VGAGARRKAAPPIESKPCDPCDSARDCGTTFVFLSSLCRVLRVSAPQRPKPNPPGKYRSIVPRRDQTMPAQRNALGLPVHPHPEALKGRPKTIATEISILPSRGCSDRHLPAKRPNCLAEDFHLLGCWYSRSHSGVRCSYLLFHFSNFAG